MAARWRQVAFWGRGPTGALTQHLAAEPAREHGLQVRVMARAPALAGWAGWRRALVRGPDVVTVELQVAARHVGCRRHIASAPLLQLLRTDLEVKSALVQVNGDLVAVVHQADRPATGGLRTHV